MRILTADSSQLRQTQLLMAIAAVATVLALLTTAQAGLALAHEGQEIPWAGLLKARLVDWYCCALFMPLLFWLARRYPVDRQQWTRTLPIHLLASVPIAILKEGIFVGRRQPVPARTIRPDGYPRRGPELRSHRGLGILVPRPCHGLS